MDTTTPLDLEQQTLGGFCPRYHHAVELIGRRWSGAIIRAMLGGVTRFSELAQIVPGLSDRMLSERLKELDAEGIVERRVFAETPVRIEYSITEKGRALAAVVESIDTWAQTWLPADVPCAVEEREQAAEPAALQHR